MTTSPLASLRRLSDQHAKPAILLAGCLSLVMALLVTAVTAAVGLGGLAGLGGLIGANPLDYARGPLGEYFPLTDAFVEDALGQQLVPSDRLPGPVGSGGEAVGFPPAPAPGGRPDSIPVDPPDDISNDVGGDDFADAYAVRGLPFSATKQSATSRQAGEPTTCAESGGTYWYRFTPRGDVDLTAATTGTDLSSAVAVFTGSTLRTLRQVACDAKTTGDPATTFAAKRGTAYWFQVTQEVTGSPIVFTLDVRATTTVASVSADGRQVEAPPPYAAISSNGRYVTFIRSTANSVGCGGPVGPVLPENCRNLYIRDLLNRKTTLVSTPDGETLGNGYTWSSAITPDGRFVAFYSYASNLVPEDNNESGDVFVRDLAAQRTTRVSVDSAGNETHDPTSSKVVISADGRFVGFTSGAPELVDNTSSNGDREVFVHDTATGRTQRVEPGEEGLTRSDVVGMSADGRLIAFSAHEQVYVSDWRNHRVRVATVSYTGRRVAGDSPSSQSLSADGRYLVFLSAAPDVVADDTNDAFDIFVRDLVAERTVRVSVSSSGREARPRGSGTGDTTSTSASASISTDGRYVAFSSSAAELVSGDTNSSFDVFIHDLRRATTTRVSVLDDGTQSSGESTHPLVADQARAVLFGGSQFRPEDDPLVTTLYVRQRPVI